VCSSEQAAATERRLKEIVAFIRDGAQEEDPPGPSAHVLFALASRVLGEVSKPLSLLALAAIGLTIGFGMVWFVPVGPAFVYALTVLARAVQTLQRRWISTRRLTVMARS
jgi:hypothetical protein